MKFAARGHGAKGVHEYQFQLTFYEAISPDDTIFKVSDAKIDFFLKKTTASWWPRLISQPQKPSWLKIDFDKWKSEEEDDDDETAELQRNVMKDYPGLYDQLTKEELGYRREQAKKVYLIIYNLAMFCGYLYILTVIAVRYSRDAVESMEGTYEAVGPAFKFCQLLQYLEVMHPIFGYTAGGAAVPFVQVSGRAFILFAMVEVEERMQTKPVIFYLFILWATVEIVRYPYYLSQLFKVEIGFLTWLRYTIWIPLYPLGILCEGIICLRNIPYFEETQRLSLALPNSWNMTFDMPTFLKIYLLILAVPGTYTMMSHMAKTRAKKLGPKNWKKLD